MTLIPPTFARPYGLNIRPRRPRNKPNPESLPKNNQHTPDLVVPKQVIVKEKPAEKVDKELTTSQLKQVARPKEVLPGVLKLSVTISSTLPNLGQSHVHWNDAESIDRAIEYLTKLKQASSSIARKRLAATQHIQ